MANSGGFSRQKKATDCVGCAAACAQKDAKDTTLSTAAAQRIEAIAGRPEAERGPASLDGPVMYSADASPCQKKAYTLGPTLRRFNRYREALPYARAASDLNKLGDGDGSKPATKECLTRLSDDPRQLCEQLGLPPGAVRAEDLRNDTTGYRAAVYRNEATGQLILVSRDTQPNSLVDWQTNTRNGDGIDTDQYKAARKLAGVLEANGVPFDVAGYSKGGGLAQEAGLVNPDAKVYVFNSAGLHPASLARTGATDFKSLAGRTQAYNAENEFLTYMNETRDPARSIENARFLRTELAGEGAGINPIKIKYRNPALPDSDDDERFDIDREAYLGELDTKIAQMQADLAAGRPSAGFPPVHAGLKEVVHNSGSGLANFLGAKKDQATLGKLAQHKMDRVLDPMADSVAADRKTLNDFLKSCG
jgi:hypothetical protein